MSPSYAPPSEPPPAYYPVDPHQASRAETTSSPPAAASPAATSATYPSSGPAGYPPSSQGYPPASASQGYPPVSASQGYLPAGYPPSGSPASQAPTGGHPSTGPTGYPPAVPHQGYTSPVTAAGYPPGPPQASSRPPSGSVSGGYPPSSSVPPALAAPHKASSGVTDAARRYSQRASGASARHTEDPLDLLKTFDTVLIVDDSGSMQLAPESGGPTRWEEARDALAGLVSLVKDRDPDGIDVHFLNSPRNLLSCTNPEAVRALFESVTPDGATPTGAKIEELMMEYLDAIEIAKQCKATGRPFPEHFVEPRKRNYLVITDGAPTDDLEDVIVSIARRLDQSHFPLSQLGFSFIQVGDDPDANEFLQELDDSISTSQGVRDIVDTTPYRGMSLSYDLIVKALLGGINRRFDRRSN